MLGFFDRKNIFICENAIFSENKTKKFFFVKEKSIRKLGKHWASGIGSFDKQHILNHRNKRFLITDEDIEYIEIEFIDFDKLIEIYQIKSIKNLQIDVEGAEFEILKTIDFAKIDIKTLEFEAKHFDGTFFKGPKLDITFDVSGLSCNFSNSIECFLIAIKLASAGLINS